MKLPDPHDTWVFYQALVVVGTVGTAIANVVSAYFIYKFYKKSVSLFKNIERNTRVVKTDVLLRRAAQARLRIQGNRVRESIADEDRFKA